MPPSNAVPCERHDVNQDLQNLAMLIKDLKKAIELHNQLVHVAMIEEKVKKEIDQFTTFVFA